MMETSQPVYLIRTCRLGAAEEPEPLTGFLRVGGARSLNEEERKPKPWLWTVGSMDPTCGVTCDRKWKQKHITQLKQTVETFRTRVGTRTQSDERRTKETFRSRTLMVHAQTDASKEEEETRMCPWISGQSCHLTARWSGVRVLSLCGV